MVSAVPINQWTNTKNVIILIHSLWYPSPQPRVWWFTFWVNTHKLVFYSSWNVFLYLWWLSVRVQFPHWWLTEPVQWRFVSYIIPCNSTFLSVHHFHSAFPLCPRNKKLYLAPLGMYSCNTKSWCQKSKAQDTILHKWYNMHFTAHSTYSKWLASSDETWQQHRYISPSDLTIITRLDLGN